MNRSRVIAVIAVVLMCTALTGSVLLAQKNKKPEPQRPRAQPSPTVQKEVEPLKSQPTTKHSGNDATQQSAQSAKQDSPCCGQSLHSTRVTADDLSRNPAGENYVVDTTRHGAVFDFDSKSRAIDFSRITVRTRSGSVSMEELLKKLLPGTADRSALRIGNPKELSRGKASQTLGRLNYNCPPGEPCTCTGDDDCNKMFTDGVCGDIAVCYPTGCACLPPLRN
jgi:hypothetical protein